MSKTSKRVAVITGRQDAHLAFVERHLARPFVVFDPQELIHGKELSFHLVNDQTVVSYDGTILDNIVSVWYRKPLPILRKDLPVPEGFQLYSQSSMERHSMLLLTAFERATWVSDYYALLRANNKNLQMAVARRLGFNVPDTVITSSGNVAQKFIDAHPQCVSKALTIFYPKVNGKQKMLLTTVIGQGFMPNLKNLYLAPSIFQEAIDTRHDIRVTVVGEKVFPAIVDSKTARPSEFGHFRDNRLGNYEDNMHIEALQNFPKELAELCVAHTKALGLRFGAIDLLLDKKGKYWFLENNPNGQWAFVEHATGQPIGKAMAALLENR